MSSIQMREEEICYQAAALLQQRMLNRGCARPQALHYGVESILTRRSTEADQIEDPLLARAFHYIWQHLASPLRVADIASHLKSSPRLLELHARRFLGRTLQDEIQRAKMSRAHQLLLGSRLTVNEVAEACGFATTSHFIFCFRKHFRHTPTDVRKRAAAGERIGVKPKVKR